MNIEKRRVLFGQALRFIVSGGIATLIDLAVLNLLLYAFPLVETLFGFEKYLVFKFCSFLVAASYSYFANKYFTFRARDDASHSQIWKFILITAIGFCVNVIIPSKLYGVFTHIHGLPEFIAANAASITGTALSLCINFIGYKFFVFNK